MRSPADIILCSALIASSPAGAAAGEAPSAAAGVATSAGAPSPAPSGAAVTPEEVRAAAAKLRADPNLGTEKKIRSLQWSAARGRTPDTRQKPAPWLVGLFEYLGQTGSVLLWVAGAIAIAIAAIWLHRTWRTRAPRLAPTAPPAVRIGSMDIRPESLPDDIGAAALALADAGKTREALSLLYRGALSRAVHRFGIAIGESYTEGEALRAVGAGLDAQRAAYFGDLVDVWRRAVYAGESTPREPLVHLCRRFPATLDAAPA